MSVVDSNPQTRAKLEQASGPLRVALIGCGAIAEQFHLPVLGGHDGLKLVALVDRDSARRERLAAAYHVEGSFSDQAELPAEGIDAAILATPPAHHAPGAIDLMQRGIHVLVEKPIALDVSQAEQMCQVAEEHDVVLSVGVYKRLLPAVRFLKQVLAQQQFGRVLAAEADWGGISAYASATLGLMRKQSAGGGVLMDLGPHVLDILTDWFGSQASVVAYHDDNCGGIEADCEAVIRFAHDDGPIDTKLRLSRVRNLPSGFRIDCEQAVLELGMTERFEVQVRPRSGVPPYVMRPASADLSESWYEPYRAEIDDWISAIAQRCTPLLSGRSCLPTMKLIEECYRDRQPLRHPWLDAASFVHVGQASHDNKPRVLITGGGGFVGSRTAEILSQAGKWNVRAHVRRPASAARLARLPVEIVQADLRSDADVLNMLADCDAVVHCAVGTDYGQKRSIHEVTVGGTRRLTEAAVKAGVKRFVHISSIGVHDPEAHDVIDVDTPMHHNRADWYGYTKGLAEQAVQRAAEKDMQAIILRPGCVYGPYGFTFVMNPLQALVDGRLILEGAADTPSNTVFIDNLVEAIRLGLEVEQMPLTSRVAVIGDEQNWTWGQYYDFFAERIGANVHKIPQGRGDVNGRAKKPDSKRLAAALASKEAKDLAKRLLNTDPLGSVPRWMLERFPQSEAWLRRRLKMDAPEVYQRGSQLAGGMVRVTPRRSSISIERAQAVLGYQPTVSREAAMEQTYRWACYAGILPDDAWNAEAE